MTRNLQLIIILGSLLFICVIVSCIIYYTFLNDIVDNGIEIISSTHSSLVFPPAFNDEVTFVNCPTSIKVKDISDTDISIVEKPVVCQITKCK